MILPICIIIAGVAALGASLVTAINLALEMWRIQTAIILKTNQGEEVESFDLKVNASAFLFLTYLPAAGLAAIIVGAVLLV